MTKDSSRLIGDIIEINSDIIDKRIHSKYPKLITNLQESYYRRKLNRSIKKFRRLYLDKFNLQELFSYILTYYNGKYKCIQKIKVTNLAEDTITTADVLVDLIDINPMVPSIRYSISIDSKPNMSITCNVHNSEGLIETNTVRRINLFYTEDSMVDYAIKVLNDNLIEVLISFLNEYLERFKTKGYMKEAKE